MIRIGQVIGIRPACLEDCKKLHAEIWPGVAEMITKCNIRNYSIYHLNGQLFAYMEYVGDDYEATWPRWLPMKRRRNGGTSANPCSAPTRTGPMGPGGGTRRKSSIRTDQLENGR